MPSLFKKRMNGLSNSLTDLSKNLSSKRNLNFARDKKQREINGNYSTYANRQIDSRLVSKTIRDLQKG